MEFKQRIVQELVPGKQITLAHVIAKPDEAILKALKIGQEQSGSSIGVINVTPPQTAVILADVAIKAAEIKIVKLASDESGSVITLGSVSAVQSAVNALLCYAKDSLGYETCEITKT